MSVLTPRRVFPAVAALLLANALFAAHPSPRTYARMAYDAQSEATVLFGGRVGVDAATARAYASDETWTLSGRRWLQRFPEHNPGARSMHVMAYDSKDDRIVLFGGRREAEVASDVPPMLNDTWQWDGNDWTQVLTADAPSPRVFSTMTYDAERDVMVLYGGEQLASDGKTLESVYDTWEFDGTNWTQVGTAGQVKVNRPQLGYDPGRDLTVLIGPNTSTATVMYTYDPATHGWTEVKPALLPPCATEGMLTFRNRTGNLLFTGGLCPVDNTGNVETYEWNGTNWVKLTTNSPGHASGTTISYDVARDAVFVYGGVTYGLTAPRSTTLVLKNLTWSYSYVTERPAARSLAAFETDPVHNTIWMYGGLDEDTSYYNVDLWRYANGQWSVATGTDAPSDCSNPGAAYDKDRNVMVVVCAGATVYEWDGAAWKSFSTLKTTPALRRFASVVYDENAKKTVLFGGYDGNFRNDTWTWDGTKWTEVTGNRPVHRALMGMWYDPLMKRTLVFGGIGRPNLDSKITRYNDMWAFDGSGWTQLSVSLTPGERFGPAVAVNPLSGKTLLFGGLRAEISGGEDKQVVKQYYAADTWEWDGSAKTWTKLNPLRVPPARENAALAWDPMAQQMVLFSGYAGGLYYSDVWVWNGQSWVPREGSTGRRRAAGAE